MKKIFMFEIQGLIKVEQTGDTAEDARVKVIDNLREYAHELIDNASISDGEESK
jgi:phosphoglycerate-specific signal transduction histidine kinase